MENKKVLKGGEYLLVESNASDVFIPEEFDEEQQMILGMCQDFLKKEVLPILDRIDDKEPGLMKSLVQKSGELGLLGIPFLKNMVALDNLLLPLCLLLIFWVQVILMQLHIPLIQG